MSWHQRTTRMMPSFRNALTTVAYVRKLAVAKQSSACENQS